YFMSVAAIGRPLHHSWARSTPPFPVTLVHISLAVMPASDKAAKSGEEFFFKKSSPSSRMPIYACPVSPPIGCKFHPDSLSISILSDPSFKDFILFIVFSLFEFLWGTPYFKSLRQNRQETERSFLIHSFNSSRHIKLAEQKSKQHSYRQ